MTPVVFTGQPNRQAGLPILLLTALGALGMYIVGGALILFVVPPALVSLAAAGGVLLGAAPLPLCLVLALQRSQQPVPVRVERGAVQVGKGRYEDLTNLVLYGSSPGPLTLLVDTPDTSVVLFSMHPDTDGPQGWPSLLDKAKETAALLDLELHVRLDCEAWDRWATQPAFRDRQELHARLTENRRLYPVHHEISAVLPPLERDLDGVGWQGFRIGPTHLSYGTERWSLHALQELHTTFVVSAPGTTRVTIWFEEAQASRGFTLTILRIDLPELKGFLEVVRQAAQRVQDTGSPDDIPTALQNLRSGPS